MRTRLQRSCLPKRAYLFELILQPIQSTKWNTPRWIRVNLLKQWYSDFWGKYHQICDTPHTMAWKLHNLYDPSSHRYHQKLPSNVWVWRACRSLHTRVQILIQKKTQGIVRARCNKRLICFTGSTNYAFQCTTPSHYVLPVVDYNWRIAAQGFKRLSLR